MAAAEHKLSRRALLGAAFAAPVLGVIEESALTTVAGPAVSLSPAGPSGTVPRSEQERSFAVTKWDRARSRFRRAKAALAALEGGPDEDAYGHAHDRFNLALRRLSPSPRPTSPRSRSSSRSPSPPSWPTSPTPRPLCLSSPWTRATWPPSVRPEPADSQRTALLGDSCR
jgi:hypothetical protein